MKVEYINDNMLDGIDYDFNLIRKEYKKLGCPKTVYNPCHLPFENAKWLITLSERARGKTTNLLLFGMCIYKLYGTGICYLRSSEHMIAPKVSKDMFSNIISWGYVDKLTDGKYNTITYKSRRWYYAKVDDEGKIVEQDQNPFCLMLSIDKNEDYKSVLETKNDFIIFDEFIERNYYMLQFVMLCDLIKTIGRERKSPVICLCANTIDIQSPYFTELQIRDRIQNMVQGENELITTPKGTRVYFEILGKKVEKADKKQKELNRLFYGFDNPKLASITGASTWAIDNYPHPPKEFRTVERRRYIYYNDKYISLDICESEEGKIFINCHLATKIYEDSIIYSLDFSLDKLHRYGRGKTKKDKWVFDKYDNNLFTYSDNSIGSLVEKYMMNINKKY